jgi:hypothetical protein
MNKRYIAITYQRADAPYHPEQTSCAHFSTPEGAALHLWSAHHRDLWVRQRGGGDGSYISYPIDDVDMLVDHITDGYDILVDLGEPSLTLDVVTFHRALTYVDEPEPTHPSGAVGYGVTDGHTLRVNPPTDPLDRLDWAKTLRDWCGCDERPDSPVNEITDESVTEMLRGPFRPPYYIRTVEAKKAWRDQDEVGQLPVHVMKLDRFLFCGEGYREENSVPMIVGQFDVYEPIEGCSTHTRNTIYTPARHD